MKKIPVLFVRAHSKDKSSFLVTEEVTSGMEWVLAGEGFATLKLDGAACAVIDGEFYKRYDAKHGKKPPQGAIACCKPDPITGHWPHWVKVDEVKDKWLMAAYQASKGVKQNALTDGTYEAIGPHFQANPYQLPIDLLVAHGQYLLDGKFERTFEGMRSYLSKTPMEGIVFWKDGEPQCKIRRKDFGLSWPVKTGELG